MLWEGIYRETGMNRKPGFNLKLAPERRLVMTFAMRQALEILQMPQIELAQWLRSEIEQNPLLELDATEISSPSPSLNHRSEETEIISPTTLHESLNQQIRENFPSSIDRSIAVHLLEYLDERGFIVAPLESIAQIFQKPISYIENILSLLQTFEPPGICARNLQESLLLQLKARGKGDSEAFHLIRICFEDLLHKRYAAIKKKLGSSDLSSAIQTLARLHFRPSEQFKEEPCCPAIEDLRILKNEMGWSIELNESEMPKFHVQSHYFDLVPESSEERESLRLFKASAKWLIRSLNRRRDLLFRLGRLLVRKQALYLDQKGPLSSITLKELSECLQVHESTLSRALAGKFASTPRGLIPLKSLISSFPETETARELLGKWIADEDKRNPLTDDLLAAKLNAKGYRVARRTVAKYRGQLKIGPASQRKYLIKN